MRRSWLEEAAAVVLQARAEIADARAELDSMRSELDTAQARVAALEGQLRQSLIACECWPEISPSDETIR